MTARGHPWLVSLAAHALLAIAGVTLLRIPGAPAPVRMHLAPPGAGKTPRASVSVPKAGASRPSAPSLPSWREHSSAATGLRTPTVPVSLDELLGTENPPETPSTGWVSEGYSAPPLPPPELAPPQGAHWSLTVFVPAGGGPGATEGLDSGHPELDQWLETYIRTVSFPPGLDGQPYQVRWNLTLVSDRPR